MDKERVYIWGAGDYSQNAYEAVDKDKCCFIGFIDGSSVKQGKTWHGGYPVLSAEQAVEKGIDHILISVLSSQPILRQAKELGIAGNALIRFWEDDLDYPFISRLFLLRRENEYLKRRLKNAPYEYGVKASPPIMDNDELFRRLREDRCSLSRFGDGEFEMIRGRERPWFQKTSEGLSTRLLEVLNSQNEEVVIAIADDFGSLEKYTDKAADGIRDYVTEETRSDIMKFLPMDRTYGDAYISRPYYMYKDKTYAGRIVKEFKRIWEDRNVIVVENPYSRIGIGNDLLSNSKSVRRIICPAKNSFDVYEKILGTIKENAKPDDVILISLGPAATVLAYDLGTQGLQTIDIGQIDTEYEWYLRGAADREEIPGKSVSELSWWHEPEMVEGSDEYHQQIMAEIKG